MEKRKVVNTMAVIGTVSDLRNYDDEFEKTKAMLRLMCELQEGRRSGEEGYVSSADVRVYFRRTKTDKR